jgi:hypothetical protein
MRDLINDRIESNWWKKIRLMKVLVIISLLAIATGCNLTYKTSKTEWNISEVKEWANANKTYSTWQGLILYQGSDTVFHHYISRIYDEWAWFDIRRTELAIKDERPFNNSSSAPLGYYYVDPNKGFIKVKDY